MVYFYSGRLLVLLLLLFTVKRTVAQMEYSSSEPTTPSTQYVPLDSTFQSEDTLLVIKNINVSGNKVTKRNVILRELPFREKEAYSVSGLVEKFSEANRLLMNTRLFIDVIIAVENFDGNKVDIAVEVRERWYIFPLPYIRPIDRNLNQWLFEKGGNLGRVNYGLKLTHNNVTGLSDKLRLFIITGYTKELKLRYETPYIDKKMKWGLSADISVGKNKEVNYNTAYDKQVFVNTDDKYIRNYVRGNVELIYRNALFTRHHFGVGYTRERVGDTVTQLNPNYFGGSRNTISIPEIYYRLSYINQDYIPYPTKGYALRAELRKKGFSKQLDTWELSTLASGSWHTGKKSFFSLTAHASAKLPFRQPYYLQGALGYSDLFLQGYEYYVMDGTLAGFLKATLSRELFSFSVKTPGKNRQIPERVPFKFYGKIYGNMGYVHNETPQTNRLVNKMLYSGGVGIDIFTSYDFCIKIEWTFNAQGENGLFLHRGVGF